MRKIGISALFLFLVVSLASPQEMLIHSTLSFPILMVPANIRGIEPNRIFGEEIPSRFCWKNENSKNDNQSKYLSKKRTGKILMYIGVGTVALGISFIVASAETYKLEVPEFQWDPYLNRYFVREIEETVRPSEKLETPGYILTGLGVLLIGAGIYINKSAKADKGSLLIDINPLERKAEIGYIFFLKQ